MTTERAESLTDKVIHLIEQNIESLQESNVLAQDVIDRIRQIDGNELAQEKIVTYHKYEESLVNTILDATAELERVKDILIDISIRLHNAKHLAYGEEK